MGFEPHILRLSVQYVTNWANFYRYIVYTRMEFAQVCLRCTCTKCAFTKHNIRRIPKIFIEDQNSVINANGEGQGQVKEGLH